MMTPRELLEELNRCPKVPKTPEEVEHELRLHEIAIEILRSTGARCLDDLVDGA